MSLGDLVISLSANTARFESDMGKAAQFLERFGNKAVVSAKQAEKALAQMTDIGVVSVDRLQRHFNLLDIKSALHIEKEKVILQTAFEQIKNSGVATANEIKRAHESMQKKIAEIDGVSSAKNTMNGMTHDVNLLSLASAAAIMKVQILYSLVNNVLSAITSFPGLAVDAIESFQESTVKNAAVITSMSGSTKDIGKAYQENRVYAEAVQNVLVKMDAQTIASYKQLQLMNDAFVNQGVFIDINNRKQLDGYKNIANALATISAGMQNADLQFSQEIRGLMNGEDKPTNMLFRQLKAIDPLLKEHLQDWKRIAAETGNAGYVLEKLGPLLVGYAAASGDIDSLWTAVKSTLSTIRDEVLRGGLKEGFEEIVIQMKELAKYAVENKEKFQAWLKEGFAEVRDFAKMLWNLGEALVPLAEPAKYAAIIAGFTSITIAIRKLGTEITLASGGLNLLIGGLATAAYLGFNKFSENQKLDERVSAIRAKTLNSGFSREQLAAVLKKNPMASNEDISSWIDAGAINTKNSFINQMAIDYMKQDRGFIKPPKAGKNYTETTGGSVDNSLYTFNNQLNSFFDSSELENYDKQIGRIDSSFMKLRAEYNALSAADKAWSDADREGGTIGALERTRDLLKANLDVNERLKGESFLTSLNKFEDRSQTSVLQRQLASIDTEIEKTIDRFNKLSVVAKKAIGLSEEDLRKMGDEYKNRLIEDDKIKTRNETVKVGLQTEEIKNNTLPWYGASDPYKELERKYNLDQALIESELEKLDRMGDLYDEQIDLYNAFIDKYNANSEKFAADKARIDKQTWDSGLSILGSSMQQMSDVLMKGSREQFEQGKKLAKASIMINTYLAASNAFASAAKLGGWWGIALGVAAAGAAIAYGTQQYAMVSGQQYEGREKGGPVTAGKSYIVGEKRAELFTPGANGVITPYVPNSSGVGELTNVFQISTGVSDTVRAEIGRLIPAITQMSVNAVRSAMAEGQFQGV